MKFMLLNLIKANIAREGEKEDVMKKKLVAFAVTAAMLVTSAVPALAWEANTTRPDATAGNQIVVDKDLAKGAGVIEEGVAGPIADTKTFTATVDLNRRVGQFEYVLGLSTDGNDQSERMVKLYLGDGSDGMTEIGLLNLDSQYARGMDIQGLVDITWTFVVNDEGKWLNISAHERGKTALEGGYSVDYKLPDTLNTVEYLALNAWDGQNATKDTKPVEGNNQIVIYQDAATAPKEVASVEVVKAWPNGEPMKEYGKVVVATQPVKGETYFVNSITLDDGTVIDGADVGKYVSFEWKAVKANGTVVWTLSSGNEMNITDRHFTLPSDDKGYYDGCYITLEVTAKKAAGIFGGATWGDDADALAVQQRLAGEDRYETAIAVADQMKPANGFENFFVATGTNYADALSATALAKVKEAPILLVNGAHEATVAQYIEDNAKSFSATTVYIVGGPDAVSEDFAEMLYKFNIKVVRLAGEDRYDTNISILKEYDKATRNSFADLLVASGTNYPDALSASATGLPILLVGDEVTNAQKDYLQTLAPVGDGNVVNYLISKMTIIGGTAAVNSDVKAELSRPAYIKSADSVTRLWGDDRYETNRAVVNAYNTDKNTDKYAFVAYGMDYADALTGGVLAAKEECSLVLVDDNHTGIASYIISTIAKDNANYGGLVIIGGENAVSNATAQKIA